MTPEEIQDLAAEIAGDIRDETFEGDKWLGFQKTRDVVAARLAEDAERVQGINAELLEALKAMYAGYGSEFNSGSNALDKARAAIAKAARLAKELK